jgi:hypothetical protein
MYVLETVRISCPYCDERIELVIDLSVSLQEYIEDCSVCCCPILLTAETSDAGSVSVTPRKEDDC